MSSRGPRQRASTRPAGRLAGSSPERRARPVRPSPAASTSSSGPPRGAPPGRRPRASSGRAVASSPCGSPRTHARPAGPAHAPAARPWSAPGHPRRGRLLRLGVVDAPEAECQQRTRPCLQHRRPEPSEPGRGRRQQLRSGVRIVCRPAGERSGERGAPGIGGCRRGIGDEARVTVIRAHEGQARPADPLQPLHAERLGGGDAGLDVRRATGVASERPRHSRAELGGHGDQPGRIGRLGERREDPLGARRVTREQRRRVPPRVARRDPARPARRSDVGSRVADGRRTQRARPAAREVGVATLPWTARGGSGSSHGSNGARSRPAVAAPSASPKADSASPKASAAARKWPWARSVRARARISHGSLRSMVGRHRRHPGGGTVGERRTVPTQQVGHCRPRLRPAQGVERFRQRPRPPPAAPPPAGGVARDSASPTVSTRTPRRCSRKTS